ncbi:hypothetical protein QO009_003096 [Brevibacillus aydinogluensis]|jgi:hypothetical protein|nr:hypothetical protein [Brevibacillus aydinogluensis]
MKKVFVLIALIVTFSILSVPMIEIGGPYEPPGASTLMV